MDDNEALRRFQTGDAVIYSATDPLRSPYVDDYRATVLATAVTPKGVKVRIEYEKAERVIQSWVSIKRVRRVKTRG